jgi:hypothetical protein
MTMTRRELLGGAAAAAILAAHPRLGRALSAAGPDDVDAAVPTAWFDLALALVQSTPGFTPPVAARAFGYAGVTLYESVVAGARRNVSLIELLPDFGGLPTISDQLHWPASANTALAEIARLLFATATEDGREAIDDLESTFADQFERQATAVVLRKSVERGRDVARAVFELSRGDGGHDGYLGNFPEDYVPPAGPGMWVPTPPAFNSALQPSWGANRCLALADGASCPAGDHTPFSEDPGSAFYAEAVDVYDAVNDLDDEQTAIARFWSDDPGRTATPPGHSISIATQVLRNQNATLITAAETYAKVGIAVCDAFVACWNTKYRYNLERPVTYIQRLIDPAWMPLLTTPPFPEYTSGHSVQCAAAFTVLADLFGDDYSFEDRAHDNLGLPSRHFPSFAAAAEEAAISRLYGGIHFRPAIERGLAQGRCVGQAVNALELHRR